MLRIGIDLGGTKIEAVALAAHGDIVDRRRLPTPPNYDGCIAVMRRLVRELEHETRIRATVGVGIPGVVVPETGLVKNANAAWLNGRPLWRDLETALERPVRIMNDANCFALSEAADGAAAGATTVFGVILGTGVGGGVVVNGACLLGANLIAGEWGHNPLPWPNEQEARVPACNCGRWSCIERWLSGPAFEQDYAESDGVGHRAGIGDAAALARHRENAVQAPEIVARAGDGELKAQAVVARYHERLGRALASVVNLLDPDVIVLGGGMSNMPELALAASAALTPWVFSDTIQTRVVRNLHGDSSGVRGAAWLWPLDRHA